LLFKLRFAKPYIINKLETASILSGIPKKEIWGWNVDAWRYPFVNSKEVAKTLDRRQMKILEIGASKYSQVAYEFDKTYSNITISYFDEASKAEIQSKFETIKRDYKLLSNYNISKIDVTKISGKYDVIILKSVLGGIFREKSFQNAEKLCKNLVNKNLNNGGILVTIDNGKSIFERLMANFGARKNGWHYILINELNMATEQIGFGFFSFVSVSIRLGKFGNWVEKLMYLMDLIMYHLIKSHQTVICSVFVCQNDSIKKRK
jgi:hypothetical protein